MSVTYLQRLQEGLHGAFGANERVVIIGEDLLDPYGGAFKVTKGLSDAFPGRVFSSPISESAIIGMATGLALRGMRPVAEIMFGDFLALGADQIINHLAKFAPMYAFQVSTPVVIRTPVGAGRGYGPTHSQSLEKAFLGTPHLKIISPSSFHDPGAILEHAILRDDEPTLFLEPKRLYPAALDAREGSPLSVEMRTEIEGYPSAIVRNHEGGAADVAIVAYGADSLIVEEVMSSLADEEIDVVACLPSSLQPLPESTILETVREAGRVVLVDAGTAGFGWTAEVASRISEASPAMLKAPPRRLAMAPTIIPAAAHLEREVMVDATRLEGAVIETLA